MLHLWSLNFWAAGGAWPPGCRRGREPQGSLWLRGAAARGSPRALRSYRGLSLCKSPRKLASRGGGNVNVASFEANHDQDGYDKEYQKLKERTLPLPLGQAKLLTHPARTVSEKDGESTSRKHAHTKIRGCWGFPGSCGHPWAGHPRKSAVSSGFQLILLGHSILR